MDKQALLPALETLARDAGSAIMEIYGRDDFQVQSKEDQSPLTAADLASHRVLVAGLKALTPDIPILSEESASLPWAERQAWGTYWLLDPLDGTKEFIQRNGEFTVNIALVQDTVPTLGVVYVPAQDALYAGILGLGAWRTRGQGAPESIRVRPAPETLVVSVSRSHANAETLAVLERLGAHEARSVGSALKFCTVAEGEVDFYPRLGPTSEWDTGAAQAVLEAAGGKVVRLDGAPLRYNTKDSLLNPHFYATGDHALLGRVLGA